MPLKKCKLNDKEGYKWGDSGKCYVGPSAKQKAIDQGLASGEIDIKEGFELSKENMDFASIKNMEIFATGEWNGKKFTGKDLDDVVKSFDEIGGKVKPYLKLGHAENQKLVQEDGLPSAGWITNLRRIGNKLVADAQDVPRKIAELINKKAYKRISSELYRNYEATKEETGNVKKKFPYALRAVALLGGDTPAVTNLDDILALYKENTDEAEAFIFKKEDFKNEEVQNMDEEMKKALENFNFKMEELNKFKDELTKEKEDIAKEKEDIAKEKEAVTKDKAEVESKTDEIKNTKAELEKLTKITEKVENIDDLEKFIETAKTKGEEADKAKAEADEVVKSAKKQEVNNFIEELEKKNKLLPNQREMARTLLTNFRDDTNSYKFTKTMENIGLKEDMNGYELIQSFMLSMPDQKLLEQFASTTKTKHFDNKGDERNALIDSWLEKNKLEKTVDNFGRAQVAVKKISPELFED